MKTIAKYVSLLDQDQRGTTAVQFALVSVPFFLIIFAIFDLGLGIWTYNNLAEATREGTRYAIVRGDGAEDMNGNPIEVGPLFTSSPEIVGDCTSPPAGSVAEVVCKYAFSLDPSRLSVEVNWENNGVEEGNALDTLVTVSATYVYEPILSNFFPFTIDLTGESTMPIMCCNRSG
jgi:hypothetical protein